MISKTKEKELVWVFIQLSLISEVRDYGYDEVMSYTYEKKKRIFMYTIKDMDKSELRQETLKLRSKFKDFA